ncbi:S-layer homology domain-containing protein [bacterium]|nr:S-layer homology domain-containing protein [bacterium]
MTRFRPNDIVTRAEFATALSRLLYGIKDSGNPYYTSHINKLYEE